MWLVSCCHGSTICIFHCEGPKPRSSAGCAITTHPGPQWSTFQLQQRAFLTSWPLQHCAPCYLGGIAARSWCLKKYPVHKYTQSLHPVNYLIILREHKLSPGSPKNMHYSFYPNVKVCKISQWTELNKSASLQISYFQLEYFCCRSCLSITFTFNCNSLFWEPTVESHIVFR